MRKLAVSLTVLVALLIVAAVAQAHGRVPTRAQAGAVLYHEYAPKARVSGCIRERHFTACNMDRWWTGSDHRGDHVELVIRYRMAVCWHGNNLVAWELYSRQLEGSAEIEAP